MSAAYSKPPALSPVPHIGQVTRQPPRDNEQRINSNLIPLAGISRREPFGGNGNTPQPIFVEAPIGSFSGVSLLDLDKGQDPPTPSDEVDFTARHSHALSEDFPPFQPQPPGRDRFGFSPTGFSKLAIHFASGQRRKALSVPSA
jgi:hypothetical protein